MKRLVVPFIVNGMNSAFAVTAALEDAGYACAIDHDHVFGPHEFETAVSIECWCDVPDAEEDTNKFQDAVNAIVMPMDAWAYVIGADIWDEPSDYVPFRVEPICLVGSEASS